MEENMNLTAERSLEIITKQIAQSRKDVSKDVGQSLFIAGVCTMGMAILIGLCTFITGNSIFYLLYFTLPFIIIGITHYLKRGQAPAPASIIGTMVSKTWITFAIFALSFFIFANLYDLLMARTESIEVYSRLVIKPFRTILLLMGMCITITGYILKSRWLVWCGIIGGLGGFIWESFYVTDTILSRFSSPASYNHMTHIVPGIMIALFAFVGLTLPGMMLKKQQ